MQPENKLKKIIYSIKLFFLKRKPVDRQDWIRLIVLAVAVPVFIYSAGQLIYRLYRYGYEDNEMEKIVNLKPKQKDDPFVVEIDENLRPDLPYGVYKGKDSFLNKDGYLAEYKDLFLMNSDLAGWMRFPGFDDKPIDYPIVYSGDNDFYLRRDFLKNDSNAGSLFFDGRNTPLHKNPLDIDRNYVIYGHAMRNKSMFGYLTDYFKNKETMKHTKIYVDLLNTRLEYEVISTFLCEPDYNYRQIYFANDTEYLDYLNRMVEKSTHDFGHTVSKDDKIMTISTCYKSTGRTAIIAKLVRQIIYEEGDEENMHDVIALPTHLPFEVPIPTKKPQESSSETGSDTSSNLSSQGQGSSVVDSETGESSDISGNNSSDPDSGEPLNLIKNPEIKSNTDHWFPGTGNHINFSEEQSLSPSGSAHVEADPDSDKYEVYQDVTDALKKYGGGKYSASGNIYTAGEDENYFRFALVVEYKISGASGDTENSGGTDSENTSSGDLSGGSDSADTSQIEDNDNSINSEETDNSDNPGGEESNRTASNENDGSISKELSSGENSAVDTPPDDEDKSFIILFTDEFTVKPGSWVKIGGLSKFFMADDEQTEIFSKLKGDDIVSARLILMSDSDIEGGFYFDDMGFFKEGVKK